MEEIQVIRLGDVRSQWIPGAVGDKEGWMKRVLYPPAVATNGVFLAVAEVNPGYPAHFWHTHSGPTKAKGYEAVYPENFAEIYHVVSGSGVMQWKTKDGQIQEKKVSAGDTIYLPADVPEHRLLNNGNEKIHLIVCGYPPPKITVTPE